MNFQKLFCKIKGHSYCKCGWCKRHPICVRCYWDRNCMEFHPNLGAGMRCQHVTYKLLELRGVIPNGN